MKHWKRKCILIKHINKDTRCIYKKKGICRDSAGELWSVKTSVSHRHTHGPHTHTRRDTQRDASQSCHVIRFHKSQQSEIWQEKMTKHFWRWSCWRHTGVRLIDQSLQNIGPISFFYWYIRYQPIVLFSDRLKEIPLIWPDKSGICALWACANFIGSFICSVRLFSDLLPVQTYFCSFVCCAR